MDKKLIELVNALGTASYDQTIDPSAEVVQGLLSYGKNAILLILRQVSFPYGESNYQVIKVIKQFGEFGFQTLLDVLDPNEVSHPLTEIEFSSYEEETTKMVRVQAAVVLGLIGDSRAIEALVETIRNHKADSYFSEICTSCAIALTRLGEPGIQKILELLNTSDNWVLYWAILAAGETEDNRVAQPLVKLAVYPDSVIRIKVLWALRKLRTLEALKIFLNAVEDAEEEIRRVAVGGLATLDNAKARRIVLEKALKDPSEKVREEAVGSIAWEAFETTIWKEPEEVAQVLLKILVEDTSVKVRRKAAHALDILKVERAIPLLIEAAKDPAGNPLAIQALANFNALEPIADFVLSLATSNERSARRRAAVLSLPKLNYPNIRQILEALVEKDQDSVIRRDAERALKEMDRTRAD